MKKKIAFVVQRYGLEVNGGAEYHCRIVAEKLKDIYDVEVLTSCAKNYHTWANEYQEGVTVVNDIKVHRFAADGVSDRKKTHSLSRIIRKRKPYQKILRFFGVLNLFEKITSADKDELRIGEEWVRSQGPHIPGLITYLDKYHTSYDALIFFTYLYYPTVFGIRVAPERSILIPTAHDEPPIYFPIFKPFFKTPKAILYNTISEKSFVNQVFHNQNIYSDIVGVGFEAVPPKVNIPLTDILSFDDEYLIYIGRIDAAKGCKMLFEYFLKYKSTGNKKVKLVIVGQEYMPVPVHEDIVALGFVEDDVKIALLKNAKALVIPSFYESLSMVTLESMAYGVPVVANQKCEVLKDHINNSNAGFLFDDFNSFKTSIDNLLAPDADIATLSENAKGYIAQNYTWSVVIEKFAKAINFVTAK